MKHLAFFPVLLAVLASPVPAAAKHTHDTRFSGLADTTIMIIRHAEKPESGPGLTSAGQARARAYVGYFEHFSVDGQPMVPAALYAAADSTSSIRPRLTIEPLSRSLNLPIDDRFADKQTKAFADALQMEAHGNPILICWHHGEIPKLIKALGGDSKALLPGDKWPENVFGWVVVLRYDHKGRLADARIIHEHLMPDDR